MKFSLNVEDGYLIDSSIYHPIMTTMLRIDVRLSSLIHEFNNYLTNVYGYVRGLYTKYSEKPIANFPLKVYLEDGSTIEVDSIYALEDVIINYKNIVSVAGIKLDEYLKIRNNLSEIVTYPYFLEPFTKYLELEYNKSLPNGEFLYHSPFGNNHNVYLVNPNLEGYEHIYNFLEEQEGLSNEFKEEAINVFEDYLTKIYDIAVDPYKTIKVVNGLNTITVNFEPSIMDKWGLITKKLSKTKRIKRMRNEANF